MKETYSSSVPNKKFVLTMKEAFKNGITRANFTLSCVKTYVILTSIMIGMTFVITMMVYYIRIIRVQIEKTYMPVIFMILGIIPILLALFVKKLGKKTIVIYGLFLLTVFVWSLAIPASSIFAEKRSIVSWLVAIFLGLSLVEGGYKFKKISTKAKLIIITSAAVLMLLGVILFMVMVLSKPLEILKFVSGAFLILSGILEEITRANFTLSCVKTYMILTSIMIGMTFVITLLVYDIESIQSRFIKSDIVLIYLLIFMISGLIPILLALFVKKLRKNRILTYGLFLLTVLFWSAILPPTLNSIRRWSFMPWIIVIFVGLPFLLEDILKVVSGVLLILGELLMLYLVGQFLKHCGSSQSSVIYPAWLALVTWLQVASMYFSITFVDTVDWKTIIPQS
uniref:Uncharacterized protein n=1 Tax=Trichobilharzia regenti TaxID=157069 RepID=A0AA85J3C2_TRIRE|nr:unnamed protein product [Trichobilharzia regenti]